ncbi:glycosyltransferase [bacterium]|nr:MAG: glycosyltransferase [bacterium]
MKRISVVIPTFEEAAGIAAAVTRLRKSAPVGALEVVVADGGSRDGTLGAARCCADRVVESDRGRAVQMHAGALAARGDLLLFLHADTTLPEDWFEALLRAWSSPTPPGATAFSLGFDSSAPVFHLIAALGNWRARFTGVPHGDQAVACLRGDYFAVGGFPPVPLMEEYFLLPLLTNRRPLRILGSPVATSTRRYEKNGPIINALRNAALIAMFKAGVPPQRLKELYS